MHGEEQAFREAIKERPRDFDQRKIFADWLDEHGRDEEAAEQRAWDDTRQDKEDSIDWLKDCAERLGEEGYTGDSMTYERLMGAAKRFLDTGEYELQDGGQDWQELLYNEHKDFWFHYHRATGDERAAEDQGEFFGCSC